jgi:DHA3 family tetracycline resistance protein-like MFS transporter
LAVAGYGLATATWQLVVACLLFNALETAGTIVWATLKQRHVPASMLGRVSSLDWLISIGLLPLSFALTAPITEMIGARMTLVGAGVGGAVITFAALFLPGMRDVEREQDVPSAHPQAEVPVDVVIVATVLHQAPSAAPPVAAARRMYP